MLNARAAGFSLIELAITLVVLSILVTLALPSFTAWIANTKIRTAAEGITNGVQLARTEAVRQNLQVQFVLGGATGASEWTVSAIGSGGALAQVQNRPSEGSGNTVIGTTPAGANTLTFNGLGRIIANGDGSASLAQVDVCSSAPIAGSDMRKMRVLVGTGGNIKMCDPQVIATDPRACPAGGVSAC